jgi:hypothetical protein
LAIMRPDCGVWDVREQSSVNPKEWVKGKSASTQGFRNRGDANEPGQLSRFAGGNLEALIVVYDYVRHGLA